jgi:LysM repeat protein
MKTTFLIIVTLFSILSVQASVQDSVGVEKKGDKYFVQHKMEAGETLYALSRKYGVSVDQIKLANSGVNINDIGIGQIILVPSSYVPKAASASASKPTSNSGTRKHTVVAKETLYSLTKRYDISVEELKKSNPEIGERGLQIGMELIIPSSGAANNTVISAVPKTAPTATPASPKPTPAVAKPATEQPKPVAAKPKSVAVERQAAPSEIASKNSKVEKINEKGHAEGVAAREDAPDFFAYHKTAPVGTIILVFNEENNQKAYVRVIGQLKTGASANTTIQLSPKAMERIKADKEVKVTLSYFLP